MSIPTKFRAWATNDKIMVYTTCDGSRGNMLKIGADGKWAMWELYDIIDVEEPRCLCNHNSGHLMQFTGILDKNGKEVYEGDVVRFNVVKGRANEPSFNNQTGIVQMSPLSLCYGVWDAAYCSQAIVVGNIYENTELT